MYDPYKQYLEDPAFHQLVKIIYNELRQGHFAPDEVKQAAVVACTMFYMDTPITVSSFPGTLNEH